MRRREVHEGCMTMAIWHPRKTLIRQIGCSASEQRRDLRNNDDHPENPFRSSRGGCVPSTSLKAFASPSRCLTGNIESIRQSFLSHVEDLVPPIQHLLNRLYFRQSHRSPRSDQRPQGLPAILCWKTFASARHELSRLEPASVAHAYKGWRRGCISEGMQGQ